jgi:transcriptional regulator with XRE-family HTH domain
MRGTADEVSLRLGSRINQLRRERGMTQAQLAEEVGIEARSLQRIEGGRTTPSVPRLCVIAEVLRVSPGALLDHTVAPRRRARSSSARDASRTSEAVDPSLLRVWERIPASRRSLALKILRLLARAGLE